MAGGKEVKDLLLQVDASVELARRNLSQLERSVAADSAKMDKSLSKVDGALGRLGGAFGKITNIAGGLGLALGAGTFINMGRDILQFADALDASAAKAGVSVERYQTLGQAFRKLELDVEQVDKILKIFTLTIGQVQNGVDNNATKAFNRLGISAKILSGEINTGDQALDAFVMASTATGTAAQHTAESVDVLGKKLGVDFAAATADGGAAMHQFEEDIRSAGLVLSEDLVTRLADANESLDAFRERAKVSATLLAGELFEIFDGLGDAWDTVTSSWMGSIDAFGNNAFFSIAKLSDDINKMIQGTLVEADAIINTFTSVVNGVRRVSNAANRGIDAMTPDWLITPDAQMSMLPKSNLAGANSVRTQARGSARGHSRSPRFGASDGIDPTLGDANRAARAGKSGGGRKPAKPKKQTQEDWINSLSATDRIIFDANNMDVPVNGGRPLGEMVFDLEKAGKEASRLVDEMGSIPIPDLANMLTEEDAERIHNFAMSFKADLAGGLAEAIVYGDNLGDVLENTFKRAAAALLESGIMNILTGGKEGTSFGTLSSNIGALFGGKAPKPRAGGGPVAANDLYLVGERGPELFVPRLPGTIVPNGGGGGRGSPDVIRVVIDRSKYFDAHVNSISGRNVAAAAPAMIEGGGNVGKAKVLRAGQRRFP